MSDGSGQAGSSNPPATSKAIPSQVKKQSDVTRMGTQKLKFVPTLPVRRKKEDVKPEAPAAPVPSTSEGTRGRGRGRGRGEGRGRGGPGGGRGAAPRPPPVEMTASGPFAMGPALAGTSARRTAPRSNFTPIMPPAPGAKLGQGLTNTTAPSLKKEPNDLSGLQKGKVKEEEDEEEVYSDADEGVEIVDMEKVRTMDWMAPESLRKEKQNAKKKVKKEEDKKGKGVAQGEDMEVDTPGTEEAGDVNLANALHLSDSEEEEELEDIIDDFAGALDVNADQDMREERLYFFQFPSPFPEFVSKRATVDKGKAPESPDGAKKVSFAEDTKPPAPAPATPNPDGMAPEEKAKENLDGIIGQLEVYASGAVKMRLSNGIVMDVTAATQPSFLQHAVHVDPENKRLCVLGEVNRRFIVSPDVDALLDTLERAEQPATSELDMEGLISMDTS